MKKSKSTLKSTLKILQVLLEELLFRQKKIFPLWKTDTEYEEHNSMLYRVKETYKELVKARYRVKHGQIKRIKDDELSPLLRERPLNWLVQDYKLHRFQPRRMLEELLNQKIKQAGLPIEAMIGVRKFPSEKKYHFVNKEDFLISISDTPFISKLLETEQYSIYMHIFLIPLGENITSQKQQHLKEQVKELLPKVIEEFVQRLGPSN